MYFDDLSREGKRYTTQWNPDDTSNVYPTVIDEEQQRRLSKEKLDAMREFLHGPHDAKSASCLSVEEMKETLTEWAHKTGLVGTEFGDEIYDEIPGIHICKATTPSGCLAQFWKSMVIAIHEYNTEHRFRPTAKNGDGSRLVMIAFPLCSELYDYKSMSMLHATVDFCQGVCLHFGEQFSLTHFHPKFKNAPKMIHPTRHSPFPVLGLHFPGKHDEYVDQLSRKYASNPEKKILDKNAPPVSRDWAKERAATFEVLYNKAAASSTADVLSRGTALRNISQRFEKEEVVDMTKKWMDKAKYKPSLSDGSPSGVINKALQFADTVQDWRVVYAKVPEDVYARVWTAISDLNDLGQALDEKNEISEARQDNYTPPFSQSQWMNSIFGVTANKNSADSAKVVSTMFVTTKFRAYNAEGFKRFAVTVNAALKRLTDDKMFIEVFHPEYVGKKGYNCDLRRSPYPTIQICYELGNSKSKN
eukprot:CAMPEP_0195507128 /NCGR_PEP_ID=MMETSP0794_2-20130614/637_1 /TAXON_ID=515487 /ORGANISM="Stephanopyxis turris, Strain CCMP 815" /LENGTH=473 /DNA_ID=CAMNT_0040633701 /DNA_START=220 /DNA_END=1641 /DNA_ORIENTATION=+